MNLDRFLQDTAKQYEEENEGVEYNLFTTHEIDTLIVAAMNGGLIPFEVETVESADGETMVIPDALTEWLDFCVYIKSAMMILHMVLAGALVPTQVDSLDSGYPGYVYRKTEVADTLLEDFGAGEHPS